MSTQQQTYSAKDFKDPLIRTLGELTGFTPGKAVEATEVYPRVAAKMSIERNAFGIADGTDILRVDRWIQFAFRDLCVEKKGKRAGKGKWALTGDGIGLAKRLRDAVATVLEAGSSLEPVRDQPEPTPVRVGAYTDAYLRALATADTPCLGAFSDQAPLCVNCPISVECIRAGAAAWSAEAAKLAEKDRTAAERARKAAEPDPKPAPDPEPPKVVLPTGELRKIQTPVECKCSICNGDIKKEEWCYWLKVAGGQGSGLYHLKCYDDAKGNTALSTIP